jgi:hypothetical protein
MVSSPRLCSIAIALALTTGACRWIAGYDSADEATAADLGYTEGPPITEFGPQPTELGVPPLPLGCSMITVHSGEAARAIWRDEDRDRLYATTASGLHTLVGDQFQPFTFAPASATWSLTAAPRALTGRSGWIVAAGAKPNPSVPTLAAIDPDGRLMLTPLVHGHLPVRDLDLLEPPGHSGALWAMVLTQTKRVTVKGLDGTAPQQPGDLPPELTVTTTHLLNTNNVSYYAGHVGPNANSPSEAGLWFLTPFVDIWNPLHKLGAAAWLGGEVHGDEMLVVGYPGNALHVVPDPTNGFTFHIEPLPRGQSSSPHAVWGASDGSYYIVAERQLWRYRPGQNSEELSLQLQSSDALVDITGSDSQRKLWVLFSRGSPSAGAAVFECDLPAVSP